MRTVTLALLHGGLMTLPCPDWCVGHPDPRPVHPVDVLHESADTELLMPSGRGTVPVLAFGLAQAPYRLGDHEVYGTVDLGVEGPVRLTPDEIRDLAAGLVEHAGRLRAFATLIEQEAPQ